MHSLRSYNLDIEDKEGSQFTPRGGCSNGEHITSTQTNKQQDPRGVGKSCAPLEVKAMVDAFLFMFLQPTLKRQWGEWGDKTATKGELQ